MGALDTVSLATEWSEATRLKAGPVHTLNATTGNHTMTNIDVH